MMTYLPGFRSGNKVKMGIASVYYVLAIAIAISAKDIGMLIGYIGIPIAVLNGLKGAMNKSKSYYVAAVVGLALFVTGAMISTPQESVTAGGDQLVVEEPSDAVVEDEVMEEVPDASPEVEEPLLEESEPAVTEPVEETTEVIAQSVQAKLHFINTGQSDCILIESDGEFMLIDGGDKDDDAKVKAYLQKVGVQDLKYVVATHFHADHLGGLDTVVRDFNVERVFVPNGDAETAVYRDFIQSCIDRGLSPSVPLGDVTFNLGNSTFRFFNVKGGYSNTNNNSLLVELTSGSTVSLFTGDAESEVEAEVLNELSKIDILKVAHHGSSSSSTEAFLDRVSPEVAVIQVGEDNSYGHPHVETMQKLKERNIEVHRNDECGDIIYTITSEGYYTECAVTGSFENGKGSSSQTSSSSNTTSSQSSGGGASSSSQSSTSTTSGSTAGSGSTSSKTVYWVPSGKSYHTTKSCRTLSRSKTILEGTQAESGKLDPCDVCH